MANGQIIGFSTGFRLVLITFSHYHASVYKRNCVIYKNEADVLKHTEGTISTTHPSLGSRCNEACRDVMAAETSLYFM